MATPNSGRYKNSGLCKIASSIAATLVAKSALARTLVKSATRPSDSPAASARRQALAVKLSAMVLAQAVSEALSVTCVAHGARVPMRSEAVAAAATFSAALTYCSISAGTTFCALASLPKPLPDSSLGKALAGEVMSASKSRTVLLYSKRVRRRMGALRAVAAVQACVPTIEVPAVTPPEPPTLLVPPPLGPAIESGPILSISAVQPAAMASMPVSANAERGLVNACMTTFRLCEGPLGNFPLSEGPNAMSVVASSHRRKMQNARRANSRL